MSDKCAKVRTVEPERRQGVIRFEMPEDTLPAQHRARVLWAVTGELDLSGFTRHAKAVDGRAGRPTYSPRMLLTLWLYATSCGVGSAREIARLTETELAYRWISGEMRGHATSSAACGTPSLPSSSCGLRQKVRPAPTRPIHRRG